MLIIICAEDGEKKWKRHSDARARTILTHTGTDRTMRLPNAIEITKQNENGKDFQSGIGATHVILFTHSLCALVALCMVGWLYARKMAMRGEHIVRRRLLLLGTIRLCAELCAVSIIEIVRSMTQATVLHLYVNNKYRSIRPEKIAELFRTVFASVRRKFTLFAPRPTLTICTGRITILFGRFFQCLMCLLQC